jgi:hypothetical protein
MNFMGVVIFMAVNVIFLNTGENCMVTLHPGKMKMKIIPKYMRADMAKEIYEKLVSVFNARIKRCASPSLASANGSFSP